MSSVNKAIIIGHLGRDPETRSFQNGGRVCNFSVATGERWKDRVTGEQKERTEWHQVAIVNDALVDVASKYLRKGSKVYVEGQLRTRKWTDQQGVDRYSTEIVIGAFNGVLTLLDRREGDAGRHDYSSYGDTPGGQASGSGGATAGSAPGTGSAFTEPLDDDVPF